MPSIIAFIPARKNSKFIPRKNLKLLNDKPLISYSLEIAQKCGLRTIVDTDDQEVAQLALASGAEVLERPSSLGKDTTPMLEVLQHEIPRISPNPDLVMLLQPTSPIRKSIHVKTAISYLTENIDEYDSLISVEKVPEKYNPYAMIIETSNGKSMIFRKLLTWREKITSWSTGKKYAGPLLSGYPISQRMTRRQDLPQAWLPDGAIYLFKADNLKNGSIYGNKVMLLETEGTLNINTEEDFLQAEEYLKNKNA